jgi:hypothetical protein
VRIGVVDLDTSHPAAWIAIERELGHEIVGVWDGGSVHPAGYAERFAQEHGIPRVYCTLAAMAADVDCAVVHGCDWDTHLAKARPFLEARKSVLLDKPLAGNVADIRELQRLADAGERITGGSSLRFCREVAAYLASPEDERGVPHTVFCGCGVDEFNYGIHAYSLLSGILGPGAVSVRHLGGVRQRRVQVKWRDGRMGVIAVGVTGEWLPFYATIISERTVRQFIVDSGALYRALLEALLPCLARTQPEAPVPMGDLVEPELCALAAKLSWEEGDREVMLAELEASAVAYDGSEFAAEYRRQKYPDAPS